MPGQLRVGIVEYLNSRPLAHGFRTGVMPPFFEAVYAPPSRVADLLAAGELDVGLVPSVELLRIPGLHVLPGPCVAATGEVRSVVVVSRGPLAQARRIALDRNSRTSQALLRILLAEELGDGERAIELDSVAPDLSGIPPGFDAALVIGDPALSVDRERLEVVDLAAWWRRVAGLPFVFAVWAVRAEMHTPDLHLYFERSLEAGLGALDEIALEAARERGLSIVEATTYFTENLRFWLGEEEIAGLREFYRRARSAGLGSLPEPGAEAWRVLHAGAARGPAHPLRRDAWSAAT
ncbi:MAG TPA: menaquinone biosynthesis protein [Thermoanaerobaculia bacterium]|nr:menaquinone biosynthesis protein [Thermoanaerobaculia bacterium]